MICSEFEAWLDEFLDDALPHASRREAERHLEECARCRRAVGESRALLEAAAALPREIEPSRDLLPGVRAAIGAGGRDRRLGARPPGVTKDWRVWAGIAASVLIVIAATLTGVALREGGSARSPSLPGSPDALPVSNDVRADFRLAEKEYIRAARQLQAALEGRADRLPPQTREVMESNLRIIDAAIEQLRLALVEDPESARKGALMADLYRQKVQMLWRVTRLSS